MAAISASSGKDLEMLPEDERPCAGAALGACSFRKRALFSALTVAQNVQVAYREHLHMGQKLMDELAAVKIAMVGLRSGRRRSLPLGTFEAA